MTMTLDLIPTTVRGKKEEEEEGEEEGEEGEKEEGEEEEERIGRGKDQIPSHPPGLALHPVS